MQLRHLSLPGALALALTVSACGAPSTASSPSQTAASASTSADEHEGHEHEGEQGGHGHEVGGEGKEVGKREPRLALSYAGGVMVVNGENLKLIKDIKHSEQHIRLAHTGNHRYLMVSTQKKGLEVLDLGSWTQKHGDHGHSKVLDPTLTGQTIQTKKAGHVSPNADHTLVFDDGDGSVDIFHDEDMFTGKGALKPEKTLQLKPHHGNAYMLEGGSIVHTLPGKDGAEGIAVIDKDGKEVTRSTDCPGTHGAAVAKGGVMTFGCEDGSLLVKDGKITKIKAAAPFARMGNQYGSADSKYVFSDYKTSEKDLADKVAVIDTEKGTMKVITTGAYAWRGIDFTDEGQGVVLTQDGRLHLVDPEKGAISKTINVLQPFKEPEDWEKPSPTVHAQGHWVYVTDPSTKKLHAIELSVMKVMATGDLPHAPNEIDGTLG